MLQVPQKVKDRNDSRRQGVKYILEVSKSKDVNSRIWFSLAQELVNASEGEGLAVKRKKDLYKACDENRAYAHIYQV